MSQLSVYMQGIKGEFLSSCPKLLHVVMGNEACDLDSAVSAIVYAFFLHTIFKDQNKTVIPLLNIPRADYPLKTEVSYWLDKHSISRDLLIFRDEIDFNDERARNMLLTLVDHNVLSKEDEFMEQNVVSILDHHKLERANPENVRDGVVVEMVGSCATLVTEDILKRSPQIIDKTIASLLYGTINLDTVNFNKEAKRVTEKDIEICEHLLHYLTPAPNGIEILQELRTAKTNISSLTSEELLRKDVKIAESGDLKIAIASVPMTVKDYLDRPDIENTLQCHSESHKFSVIVVMGITYTNDVVRRDIAVFSQDAELKRKVALHLKNANGGTLQLEESSSHVQNCLLYQQKNNGASRKVVLPFIKEWLSSNASK